MDYRPLTDGETALLVRKGCVAEGADWNRVQVASGFDPERLRNVRFGGQVRIGDCTDCAVGEDEASCPAGVRNAHLINCTLGNNVRISNVGVHLANYDIADDVCIEDVGTLEATPGSQFGNGIEVDVLNEGGGREIILFDGLSSQFAHLMCLHRHRPKLIEALSAMAREAAEKARSDRGTLGKGTVIRSVSEMINVNVGEYAKVTNAVRLTNGSILSRQDAPTTVGAGVLADDFIIAEGSDVSSGAIIERTYVGQGCQVGRQFSAESCAFFANCEAFHGEACSVLAGPYSVTHHKSTLLIAVMLSFYNAGSGTNSSNHMYKLGPVHEGKLERGCKTGSFSYMMWPCRVGPFSVILGKHTSAFDTADLPFSTIEASADGRAKLVPGLNLATVGTVRDGMKWPARDRRKGVVKRDRVSLDVLSPLTVERLIRGSAILKQLQEKTDKSVATVAYQGVEIKRVFLRMGQKYYRRAIGMYLAEQVVSRVEGAVAGGATTLADALASLPDAVSSDRWVDIGGQLMPAGRLEDLCSAVEDGRIDQVESLHAEFDHAHRAYDEDRWLWVRDACRRELELDLDKADAKKMEEVAESLRQRKKEFLELILVDATKEFDAQSRTGFGLDGDAPVAAADFQAVRGQYDENEFIKDIRRQIHSLDQRVDRFKEMVTRIG